MVVCLPLSEVDYAQIIFLVKYYNPFVSGNNSGFGLNTPNVPNHLSLVNVPNHLRITRFTKRKVQDAQFDSSNDVHIGTTYSAQECVYKKFKTAHETGRVIDLTLS